MYIYIYTYIYSQICITFSFNIIYFFIINSASSKPTFICTIYFTYNEILLTSNIHCRCNLCILCYTLVTMKTSIYICYRKTLRSIEELMWQHRQEARQLKQKDGDIARNQKIVRKTLRDYEIGAFITDMYCTTQKNLISLPSACTIALLLSLLPG